MQLLLTDPAVIADPEAIYASEQGYKELEEVTKKTDEYRELRSNIAVAEDDP